MSWNSIYGQDRIKTIIQNAIINQKVAGAYLFYGSEGIGKEAFAIEFTKVFNCQNPIYIGSTVNACDKCKSCHDIEHLIHNNIKLVFAMPTPKTAGSDSDNQYEKLDSDQLKAITNEIDSKVQDKYYRIRVLNANIIKVSAIRDIKKWISLSSDSSYRKVAIILNAEEMNTEASNSFLKTLEEPNENCTIILVTSRPEMLLQTIHSRCQKIKFDNLSPEIIQKFLVDKYEIDPIKATLISSISDGSFTTAIQYAGSDMIELRNFALEFLRTMLKPRGYRADLGLKIAELLSYQDKSINQTFIKLLIQWFRDSKLVKVTNSSKGISNIDNTEALTKFAERFGNADFQKASQLCDNALRRLTRNVNPTLTLTTMALELRKVLIA